MLSLVILLFLLLPLLPPFSYFSSFSSFSSGSTSPCDSLMHVFQALPRCLGSWAACCGGSVFCVSSVLAIFRPMFSSISGGGG